MRRSRSAGENGAKFRRVPVSRKLRRELVRYLNWHRRRP